MTTAVNKYQSTNSKQQQYSVPPLHVGEDLKMDESRKRRFSVSAEDSERSGVPKYEEEFEKKVYPKSNKVKQRIIKSVQNLFIWKGLDKEQQNLLIDAMFEKKVKKGDSIIAQGDVGDYFYVVESGIYEVWKSPNIKKNIKATKVFEYKNNGSFGELALLYNADRAASVICVKDGILWAVDGETFRYIMVRHTIKRRAKFDDFLKTMPIFKTLSDENRGKLADCIVVKEYENGDIIIKQGSESTDFYIIQHGTIEVFVNKTKKNTLNDGNYFGERGLILNTERSATCKVASKRARLLVLDKASFCRMVDHFYDKLQDKMKSYFIDESFDILSDDE